MLIGPLAVLAFSLMALSDAVSVRPSSVVVPLVHLSSMKRLGKFVGQFLSVGLSVVAYGFIQAHVQRGGVLAVSFDPFIVPVLVTCTKPWTASAMRRLITHLRLPGVVLTVLPSASQSSLTTFTRAFDALVALLRHGSPAYLHKKR